MSAAAIPFAKKRRPRLSHDQIKSALDLLSDIPRPLSPTLPPSPPLSRSGSPTPAAKRRRVAPPPTGDSSQDPSSSYSNAPTGQSSLGSSSSGVTPGHGHGRASSSGSSSSSTAQYHHHPLPTRPSSSSAHGHSHRDRDQQQQSGPSTSAAASTSSNAIATTTGTTSVVPIPPAPSSTNKPLTPPTSEASSNSTPRGAGSGSGSSSASTLPTPAIVPSTLPSTSGSRSPANASMRNVKGKGKSQDTPQAATLATVKDRPRRTKRAFTLAELQALVKEHETSARALKRSGEARLKNRLASSSTSNNISSAAAPATGSSLVNKHASSGPGSSRDTLIGLLEFMEGMLEFVYKFWAQDEVAGLNPGSVHSQQNQSPAEKERATKLSVSNWKSLDGLIKAVREAWRELALGERQKSLLGIVSFVEAVVGWKLSSSAFNNVSRTMAMEQHQQHQLLANAPSPASSSGHSHGHGPSPVHPSSNLPHARLGVNGGATALISPEPSPQASGSSALMSPPPPYPNALTNGHSSSSSRFNPSVASPRPPFPGSLPNGPDQSTAWRLAQDFERASRKLDEANQVLGPAVLAGLYPLTWKRCQEGSGSGGASLAFGFAGRRMMGMDWERMRIRAREMMISVGEGAYVDLKACVRAPPSWIALLEGRPLRMRVRSELRPRAKAPSVVPTKLDKKRKRAANEEQEDGEAEESDAMSIDDSDEQPSPYAPPSRLERVGEGENEEGEYAEDDGVDARDFVYDDENTDQDLLSLDEEDDDDVGARWAYPFTSPDHVPHVVGFAKSLLYELAREELPGLDESGARSASAGWNGSGTAYRSVQGINAIY